MSNHRFAIRSIVSLLSLVIAGSAFTGCMLDAGDHGEPSTGTPGAVVAADRDADDDGVADDVDVCADFDDLSDADGDGVLARNDLCEGGDDALDADEDGVSDACDVCAGDDSSGDGNHDGFCDRPYTGAGYACSTMHFSDKGWCMWDCDTAVSEAMSAGTCFGHDPNLQGCCYECVSDCVKLGQPVPACVKRAADAEADATGS